MKRSVVAYAGRPWPIDESPDDLREVARFTSLDQALKAFRPVSFIELPALNGRTRWRGMSPKSGLIVQIERPLSA